MPDFRPGDVVRAPFPYTDRDTTQYRPALVVSGSALGPRGQLCWVVMITSADNRSWPNDVPLGESYAASGLPAPSVIRPTKIATVDAGRITRLGRVPDALFTRVSHEIDSLLGRHAGAMDRA